MPKTGFIPLPPTPFYLPPPLLVKEPSVFHLLRLSAPRTPKNSWFALLACFTACTKTEPPTPAPTATDQLVAHPWRWSAGTTTTFDGATGLRTVVDEYAALPACERDNTYTFQRDKSLVVDEGASKCVATAPQQVPGRWELYDGPVSMTLATPSFSSTPYPFLITQLSATTFKLYFSYPAGMDLITIDRTFIAI